jgi:D-3-phosphoglycerate dehydrogenase
VEGTIKVLISDKLDGEAIDLLRERGMEVDYLPDPDLDVLGDKLKHAEGWIVRSGTQVTAELLAIAPALRVIGRAGVGVDNIDVAEATRRGIAVLNTPSGNTVAAVEHTLAMLLSLVRNIPQAHGSLVVGREWRRSEFAGIELYGKTLGIVGLGKIGSRVATRCRAFEMELLGFDPYLPAERAESLGVELFADLDEMLARCDFITLHMPGTAETENLLNSERISRLKRGVRVVNCARGNLVDETALVAALVSGQVGGAAIDVFRTEPALDSPFLDAPNVIVTPHLGASTVESQRKVGLQVAAQVADAMQEGIFQDAVNIPVRDWALFKKLTPQLTMVERLGSVAQQYSHAGISRIEVEYRGGPFEEVPALNNTLLKGLLTPVLGDSVNAVNAPLLARERGLVISHTLHDESADYNSLVKIRVHSPSHCHTLSATTFADRLPRLVELDGHDVELYLEGNLLVFLNLDRPGVIGDVGRVLGVQDINIAHFSLGRKRVGGEALAVVVTDAPVPPAALLELESLANMQWLKQISLTPLTTPVIARN